jgi:hypothetical protein
MGYHTQSAAERHKDEIKDARFWETHLDIERRFWDGEFAGEFAEYADASDLAFLAILLIRTPWEDLRDVISAQAVNEYNAVRDAIDAFIYTETRKALGWD